MNDIRQQLEDAWSSAQGENQTQSTDPQTNVATSEDNASSAPAEPSEVITAPNSYKQEFKDSFNTLTPAWQKYLSDREKEVEQGLSRARNQYKWVDKLYTDRKDDLSAMGYQNAQEYLSDLDKIFVTLDQNPRDTIDKLSQFYGIDGGAANDNTLQRQLAAISQKLNEHQRFLDAQRKESVQKEYEAFMNAKDDKGNPKYAFYNDVSSEMANLIRAGLAKNFEEAYNQAIWRVEDVRNKIIAQKAGESIQEKADVVGKAKSAAFDPSSKTEGSIRPLSLREEIERNYNRFME